MLRLAENNTYRTLSKTRVVTTRKARAWRKVDAIACIAGDSAAMMYELQKSRSAFRTMRTTARFVVLGKQVCSPSPADKTSLILAAPNKAGSVFELIDRWRAMAYRWCVLSHAPRNKKAGNITFTIDFIGHAEQDNVAKHWLKSKRKRIL